MKWLRKKSEDRPLRPLEDPHIHMADRAAEAIKRSIDAANEAVASGEEAQRLLGAIRREVAITKAQGAQRK
jgi:hypothetical protein